MSITENARHCLACNEILKGRSDKKFCDDYCRNVYNNRQKSSSEKSTYIRMINKTLMKNRRILETLLPDGQLTCRVHKEQLQSMGFQFRYTTHTYVGKTGKTYHYCYDLGYLHIEKDWYLAVRSKNH